MEAFYELFSSLGEKIIDFFGAYGEPELWLRHFSIYFFAGLATSWVVAFVTVRMMRLFRQRRPEIGVWLSWMIGFAIVGIITTLLTLFIAYFAKQQGISLFYALGYGIFVILCFVALFRLYDKVERSCEKVELTEDIY